MGYLWCFMLGVLVGVVIKARVDRPRPRVPDIGHGRLLAMARIQQQAETEERWRKARELMEENAALTREAVDLARQVGEAKGRRFHDV